MSLFVKIIVLIYCSSFLRFFAEIPNVRIAPTIISDQAAIGAVSPVPGPLASPRTPTSGAAASPRTPTSGCTGANASPQYGGCFCRCRYCGCCSCRRCFCRFIRCRGGSRRCNHIRFKMCSVCCCCV